MHLFCTHGALLQVHNVNGYFTFGISDSKARTPHRNVATNDSDRWKNLHNEYI